MATGCKGPCPRRVPGAVAGIPGGCQAPGCHAFSLPFVTKRTLLVDCHTSTYPPTHPFPPGFAGRVQRDALHPGAGGRGGCGRRQGLPAGKAAAPACLRSTHAAPPPLPQFGRRFPRPTCGLPFSHGVLLCPHPPARLPVLACLQHYGLKDQTVVAVTSGANMNFDRLRLVAGGRRLFPGPAPSTRCARASPWCRHLPGSSFLQGLLRGSMAAEPSTLWARTVAWPHGVMLAALFVMVPSRLESPALPAAPPLSLPQSWLTWAASVRRCWR